MASFEYSYTPARTTDVGAAIVIYGLDPIPGQLDRTVDALSENNNVFTYSYGNEVIKSGDPQTLCNIIDEIREDIKDKTSEVDPERIRMAGASLGTFVAFNIQKQLELPLPGLYCTAGVNVARNVMYNPIFRAARKAYARNNIGLEELDQAWKDIDVYPDQPPSVPGVCAISRLDPVVPYPFANRNLKAWQKAGSRTRILRNWVFRYEGTLLHTAAINYFDSSIREILEISKSV